VNAAPGVRGGGQERASAQRDRILAAAKQCFIEHGFHAASMASIAEAADISAGLIYRYFDNKNAIILAIIERHPAQHAASDDRAALALAQHPDAALMRGPVRIGARDVGIHVGLVTDDAAEVGHVPCIEQHRPEVVPMGASQSLGREARGAEALGHLARHSW